MKVIFRVDASAQAGIGHLVRCLTLAESLRERGVQVRFICREHIGNLIAPLQRRAFPVAILPKPATIGSVPGEDYSKWLGVTQKEDAEQTIAALDGERPDYIVVDHYGIDEEWERQLRPHTASLVVVDDLANRRHDCDVLLDQNYSIRGKQRYTGLVSDTCKLLVGPRYALLRPEYSIYRKTSCARDGQVRKIMVFFGGADPQNVTGMALEALSHPKLKHLEVDVVVGINNRHREAITQQILCRPLTTLYESRSHLADIMAKADLALGACGTTAWERMCLGLPTVVVSIAENQRPASEALSESGLIHYAGHYSDIKPDRLTAFLWQQIQDASRLSDMSTQNQLHVDGLGALRLVEVLCPTDINEVRLRPARDEDAVVYYNWTNTSEIHKGVVNVQATSWTTHQSWFANKLYDPACHMFILEASGLSVGQVRFDKVEDGARLDYSLDMIMQGRGWGPRLVKLGTELVRKIKPTQVCTDGEVEKRASSGMFLSMDFTHKIDGLKKSGYSIAILSDQTSWMNDHIQEMFFDWLSAGHRVLWVHDKRDLTLGDFCFYLSCSQIIPIEVLSQFRHNLVVHESDLPRGRGWSPLTWQILEGKNKIPVTLFEAEEKVDSGSIYAQAWIEFEGHELVDELREAQAKKTIELCKRFIDDYPRILSESLEQAGDSSYYPRRRPSDSLVSPDKTVSELFGLLRVADPERYPCFFRMRNHTYKINLEKYKNEKEQ